MAQYNPVKTLKTKWQSNFAMKIKDMIAEINEEHFENDS